MKILMVLTSHDKLGATGQKTGFWLEEFAAPYYVFVDAGADVTLASPLGGQPPEDPKSDAPESQTDATRRFRADPAASSRAGPHAQTGRPFPKRFRRDILSRRPWPALGSRGGQVVHRAHRRRACGRQAGRRRLPCARRAPTCENAAGAIRGGRQEGHRLHQQRGTGGRADRGRAFSCRGHASRQRRRLFEGWRLAAPCRRRWAADHRAESRVIRTCGKVLARQAARPTACRTVSLSRKAVSSRRIQRLLTHERGVRRPGGVQSRPG